MASPKSSVSSKVPKSETNPKNSLDFPQQDQSKNKACEAILPGLIRTVNDTFNQFQLEVIASDSETKGRSLVMKCLEMFCKNAFEWLSYDDMLTLVDKIFCQLQEKSGSKPEEQICHSLLKLKREYKETHEVFETKIESLKREREQTNKEIAKIIDKFEDFSKNVEKRRRSELGPEKS